MNSWHESYLKNVPNDNTVETDIDGEYTVKGFDEDIRNDDTIIFWAANPATYNGSYSGSGLPFPNPEIAYQNSINR